MNAFKPTLLAPSLVMLTAGLAACQSAPTRLYTLYTVAAAAAPQPAYGGPPIRVDAVRFPPDLDRIEVVRDTAPGQLRLSDVDHWAAPLGELAREALSADLVERLPMGKILFPHLLKPAGTLGVSVDVLDFTVDRHGARLQASWEVTASGAMPLPSTGGTAVLRTSLPDTNAAAIARALSTLIGQLADHIVAELTAQK